MTGIPPFPAFGEGGLGGLGRAGAGAAMHYGIDGTHPARVVCKVGGEHTTTGTRKDEQHHCSDAVGGTRFCFV